MNFRKQIQNIDFFMKFYVKQSKNGRFEISVILSKFTLNFGISRKITKTRKRPRKLLKINTITGNS